MISPHSPLAPPPFVPSRDNISSKYGRSRRFMYSSGKVTTSIVAFCLSQCADGGHHFRDEVNSVVFLWISFLPALNLSYPFQYWGVGIVKYDIKGVRGEV